MKENNLPILFALDGIHTEEFAIIEEAYNRELENKITYSLNTELGVFHKKDRSIICAISFKYSQGESPFLKIKVACRFLIQEDSWINSLKPENSELFFPTEFANHIVVLTLGTLRGVLHAKTEGTEFNRFFIPTINVAELSKGVEGVTLSLNH